MLEKGQRVLARYVVERSLGAGGMGAVYVGRHEQLDFQVAIKLLLDARDDDLKDRFQREAKLMGKVRHPNVVSVLDYGFLENGVPCIVMDFVEGEPLNVRLSHLHGVPWLTACDWTMGILGGLGAMHEQGVLHRDLKPANIVLARGVPEFAKLIDFGIAKDPSDKSDKLTQTGHIVGTPAYMSPEQLLGAALDERSDLYAAGLILWEMLAGSRLAKGNDATSVIERLRAPPPLPKAPAPLPPVPRALQDLVLSSLMVDPQRRPPSALEFVDRLRAITLARTPLPRAAPVSHESPTVWPGAATPRAGASDELTPPTRRVAARGGPPGGSGAPAGVGEEEGGTRIRPRAEARPEPAPLDDFPEPFEIEESEPQRYLVAARIPASRLVRQDERRWLATLTGRTGRGFTLGQQFWFAWQTSPTTTEGAKQEAQSIAASLEQRYGDAAHVAWKLVDSEFRVTTAQLTGAAPLPDRLKDLMDQLAG